MSRLLSETTMAVPLPAATRVSLLKELVKLAEQSWQVYDPDAIMDAIRQPRRGGQHRPGFWRCHSALAATAGQRSGRVTLPMAVLGPAFPSDAPNDGLTDIFFLVLCATTLHLRVLARLSRLLLRPNFLEQVAAAETSAETYHLIEEAEPAS